MHPAPARAARIASRTLRSPQWKQQQPLFPARRQRYHSSAFPVTSPFSSFETSILTSALSHVPLHGFTETALIRGAQDAGYLDATVNLFPRGAFDLIAYHLASRRLALADEVQFSQDTKLATTAKVRALTLHRLRANGPLIQHWQQALAVMAQPSYVPASLRELSLLADEIWFLAGDAAVDMSWYSKRATLAAVYSSAELYMTTDSSEGFRDTERFLDQRLEELAGLGSGAGAVGEWVSGSAQGLLNVLRSKGARI